MQRSNTSSALSSVCAADDLHQLGDLAPLGALVARGNGFLNAVGDMVAQDFLLGASQRGAHRRDLGDDVDAVAILLNHAREATNLPLDPLQPFEAGCLDVLAHASYIPLTGI